MGISLACVVRRDQVLDLRGGCARVFHPLVLDEHPCEAAISDLAWDVSHGSFEAHRFGQGGFSATSRRVQICYEHASRPPDALLPKPDLDQGARHPRVILRSL